MAWCPPAKWPGYSRWIMQAAPSHWPQLEIKDPQRRKGAGCESGVGGSQSAKTLFWPKAGLCGYQTITGDAVLVGPRLHLYGKLKGLTPPSVLRSMAPTGKKRPAVLFPTLRGPRLTAGVRPAFSIDSTTPAHRVHGR